MYIYVLLGLYIAFATDLVNTAETQTESRFKFPDLNYTTGGQNEVKNFNKLKFLRRVVTQAKTERSKDTDYRRTRSGCVKPKACKRMVTIEKTAGRLKSPCYSRGYYPNKYNCLWKLVAPKGKVWKITFLDFKLQPSSNCKPDYLAIYRGTIKATNVLALLCGSDLPEPIQSPGRTVIFNFRSDATKVFPGYRLKYEMVDKVVAPATFACPTGRLEFTADTGLFASPDYSPNSQYSANSKCEYSIEVSANKVVHIEFLSLDMEQSHKCRYDFVKLFDGPSSSYPKLGRLCGDKELPTITASTNQVFISFGVDSLMHYPGFKAKYTAVDPIVVGEECGRRPSTFNDRIVGGTRASPNSFPWQVALTSVDVGFAHWCGGSIISHHWILTAAHCTVGFDGENFEPKDLQVLVGLHDYERQDQWQRTISVKTIIQHERYVYPTRSDDIALLELEYDIIYNPAVKPICLPSSPVQDAVQCITTGWGSPSSGSPSVRFLQQVTVPIISNAVCASQQYYGERVTDDMLCAGYPQGGRDSCDGDSGGPLVCIDNNNQYILHGATNWGLGCADPYSPGVYAKIHNYMPWITGITGLNSV